MANDQKSERRTSAGYEGHGEVAAGRELSGETGNCEAGGMVGGGAKTDGDGEG